MVKTKETAVKIVCRKCCTKNFVLSLCAENLLRDHLQETVRSRNENLTLRANFNMMSNDSRVVRARSLQCVVICRALLLVINAMSQSEKSMEHVE